MDLKNTLSSKQWAHKPKYHLLTTELYNYKIASLFPEYPKIA